MYREQIIEYASAAGGLVPEVEFARIEKGKVTVQKVTAPRGVDLRLQGNPETYERQTA